jgi:eukaryotic-like serine/threonine-protein kinase
MAEPPVRPGQVVGGRYRVDEIIGAGAMGYVVSAWHLELDQAVALKVLNPDVFERNEALQRFRREVRAAARIKSEHVCRVNDVGTLETGEPFMVMELLHGNNLEEELHRRRVLPLEEAVRYMIEAIEAVAEAHAAGIVHRDLKPANLFITRRADRTRLIKVLDFGISKSMADSQPNDMSLTKTGVIIGSPLYMSPEQMRSTKDADARSDVWSLGAILFQLITGRPPYTGESIPELCSQLFSSDAPLVSTVSMNHGLPPALDAVLARALSRDPSRRYQSVAEFGAALLDFAPPQSRVHVDRARRVLSTEGEPASMYPPGPQASARTIIEASVSNAAPGRTVARPHARKLAAVAVLAGVLIAVIVVAMQRGASGDSPDDAPAAAQPPRDPPASPSPVPATAEGQAASPTPVTAPEVSAQQSAAPGASPGNQTVRPAAVPTAPPTAAARKPVSAGTAAKPAGGGISDFGGRR